MTQPLWKALPYIGAVVIMCLCLFGFAAVGWEKPYSYLGVFVVLILTFAAGLEMGAAIGRYKEPPNA